MILILIKKCYNIIKFFIKFYLKIIYKLIFQIKNFDHSNIINLPEDVLNIKKIIIGKKIFLGKKLTLKSYRNGTIYIGDNCRLENHCILESLKADIIMGNNSTLNQFSVIRAWGKVNIGNGVRIGPSVQIMAMNHNFSDIDKYIYKQGLSGKGINIGNNVWIGGNVVVLDGVTIGENCVVGASSVITKDVPPNSLVVGNPGKVIRKLDFKIGDSNGNS